MKLTFLIGLHFKAKLKSGYDIIDMKGEIKMVNICNFCFENRLGKKYRSLFLCNRDFRRRRVVIRAMAKNKK